MFEIIKTIILINIYKNETRNYVNGEKITYKC